MKELLKKYEEKKEEISRALNSYKEQKDLFYELCFCLLTPQSNAFRCNTCVEELKKRDFKNKRINLPPLLRNYTRFHNTKSKRLEEMKKQWTEIEKILKSKSKPSEKHFFLVENVKGIGPKEAAHFLRNIGYENMCILDRHILKHLHKNQRIKSIPRSLGRKEYQRIEQIFREFAEEIQVPLDHLDLLFWSEETGRVFK